MSIEEFVNHINETNSSERITDLQIRNQKFRQEAATIIGTFTSTLSREVAKTNIPHTDFGILFEGISGFKYLNNILIFYPTDMKNIDVRVNGNTIDHLTTKTDGVYSSNGEKLSQKLLESYLPHLMT